MLVLSRKIGEVVTIGNSVQITVLSYDRGIVRLGIKAPKAIPVHRKEVHDKIVEINKHAARTQLMALQQAIANSGMRFSKLKGDDLTMAASIKPSQILSRESIK